MENIHRHRLEYTGGMDFRKWKELILAAVAEVRGPILGSTLTSVAVFLPINFTAPLTNAILGDQARTVVYALGLSLLFSSHFSSSRLSPITCTVHTIINS